MTPDPQAVREAAERAMNPPYDMLEGKGPWYDHATDAHGTMFGDLQLLAQFALAQLDQADGGEAERRLLDGRLPVTDHWLMSIGFNEVFGSEVPDYQMLDERGEIKMVLYQCENVFVCAEPEWPYDIVARQQVLDLMKCLDLKASALGIQPRGEEKR